MTPPIIILTGPSGAGKSSVSDGLLKRDRIKLRKFVTCTTRPKRPGERNGKEYWFLTQERFAADVKDGWFFEHAIVYGNGYGSSKREMERLLKGRVPILMVLDIQGARTLKTAHPNAFILFLRSPKRDLIRRVKERKPDPADLKRRTASMEREIGKREIADVLIHNPDGELAKTVRTVESAISRYLKGIPPKS